MKIRILLLSLLFFVLNSISPNHAIYLSVVELTHSETPTLTIKVFTNDLQDIIRNYSTKYVPKSEDEFIAANRKLIEDYFQKNLLIQVNEKAAQIQLRKTMQESDVHFLYFSMNADANWVSLEVIGAFFTELFPIQSNIFTLDYKEKKYFGRMTKKYPTYSIVF